jgi:hypothetical protein
VRRAVLTTCLMLTTLLSVRSAFAADPVWPPAPATPRVEYVRQILLSDLNPQTSFLGRVGRFLGGGTSDESLSLPFNLMVTADRIFLTCQSSSALVEIDPAENSFRRYNCDDHPMVSPIGLARMDEIVYVADSGNGTVYRLIDDDMQPWITTGLVRPTGLVALAEAKLLVVIDTGAHRLNIFDLEGQLIQAVGQRGDSTGGLNFPTFATVAEDDILVNDTLNYQIKRFDGEGLLKGAFGEEGDGPGTFARPKGMATDADGNIWVVDALFDNVQVFNRQGRLLLIIGGPGQAAGEFWSPVGIAVHNDEVYIADTFNNRIQVLRYLGGEF